MSSTPPTGDDYGIRAVGAYTPDFRVPAEAFAEAWDRFAASGIDSVAAPDADEDTLTMAWEAARRALDAAGVAGPDIEWVALGTTTPPLAEEDPMARLGSVLDLPPAATGHLFTGSTRAGTRALVAALEARPTHGLVVASDAPAGPPDEGRGQGAGAGAAALVVGPGAPARVVDRAEHAEPYPGTRFREAGEERLDGLDIGSYDRQAFVGTIRAAVEGLETDAPTATLDAVALQAPDGKLPGRALGTLGVERGPLDDHATVRELGDTAAASVPLSLARALVAGAGRTLAVSHGSGAGADVLLVETDGTVPGQLALEGSASLSYARYLRLRGELGGGEPSGGGAYVSVPSWRRSLPSRHRLVAGRCPDCGALTFPPEGACSGCDSLVTFESVSLWGEGTVEAATRIGRGGAPPEFAAQQTRSGAFTVAIVRLTDGNERVSLPAQVVDEVAIGDRVQPVIRRVYTQEGVTRYGVKFRAV